MSIQCTGCMPAPVVTQAAMDAMQERVVDYKVHTHATYAVCDAADAFQAAPAYTRELAAAKKKQAEQVGRWVGVYIRANHKSWMACGVKKMLLHSKQHRHPMLSVLLAYCAKQLLFDLTFEPHNSLLVLPCQVLLGGAERE